MVQVLIDIAHMIAALALSLVGISYEPAQDGEESEQASLFQTAFVYASSTEPETTKVSLALIQPVAASEMPHAITQTGVMTPIHLQIGKLDLDVETYDIQFERHMAAPMAPQAPEANGFYGSGCPSTVNSVVTETVVLDT